ncbi:TraC family protein [Sphingobium sp. B1D7B]|uniref:TraC family protein n=1 Tax=Sphingobium sp. B1D7B TaxID=2940578 RepID=UPI0039B66A0A
MLNWRISIRNIKMALYTWLPTNWRTLLTVCSNTITSFGSSMSLNFRTCLRSNLLQHIRQVLNLQLTRPAPTQ